MDTPNISALVDAFEDVLTSTLSLVRTIPEHDADLPTDCPGWTVRDQLSHMVGLEQILSGAPTPAVELPPLAHVVSEFDIFMEQAVHVRRGLPLSAIADELDGLLPRRLAQLREQAEQGDPLVSGPFGERPLSASMPIRVLDLWAHEQDIRRAIGLPPRITGPAADASIARTLAAWATVIPAKTPGTDGTLVIRVTGPEPSGTTITLGAGGPVATLTGDVGQLTWLGFGRGAPDAAMLDGDPAVIAAVAPHLGFTP